MEIKDTDIFHVHTYRCKHAEEIEDEVYVRKAIELGATGIWFSDHAPFPNDPFGHRMSIDSLDEYLDALYELKEKYEDTIAVHVGLEIEYLPSFRTYYEDLKSNPKLELLMLGQHMFEVSSGIYSFHLTSDEKNRQEYLRCGIAIIEGLMFGAFDVIAHPDRIFKRRKKNWDENMEVLSKKIIEKAFEQNVLMEKNLSSVEHTYHYRKEFWQLVPDETHTVYGVDAHSLLEMEERWRNIC